MSAPDPRPVSTPKREISPARLAANRANAARSTGPRTPEGKARSRLNGLTHGLSAQLAVLPGEDPEALQERLDTWTVELGAATDAERYLVANAVHASWRMDRCRNAETAALTRQVLDAEERYDDQKAREVAGLADKLADDPDGVVWQLRQSSAGCAWLIAQWQVLARRLEGWTCLEPSQRYQGTFLMGKREIDLFVDPVATRWAAAQLAGLFGNVDVEPARAAAYLAGHRHDEMDEAEFARHVRDLCAALPDRATGHALLKQYVAEALAELAERAELVALREERDRALAVECASFDAGPAGASRLRYEMAHERSLRAALRELRALQTMRREQGEAASDAPDVLTADAPTEPKPPTEPRPPADAPADEVSARPLTLASAVAPTEPRMPGAVFVTGFHVLDSVNEVPGAGPAVEGASGAAPVAPTSGA